MVAAIDGQVTTLPLADEKAKWSEHGALSGTRHVRLVLPFAVDREYLKGLAAAQTFQFRVESRADAMERCAYGTDLREVGDFLRIAGS